MFMAEDNAKIEETPRFFYPEDTITESASDNSLETYERGLGFNRDSLEGKTVLDLGTGQTDRLARELKEADIKATVISVSPDFKRKVNREILSYYHPDWKRRGVAAIAQQLPFKDDSFDVILGLYGVINYASIHPWDVRVWVPEVARVLKLGGEARFGPTYGLGGYAFGKQNEILIESARESGLELTIREEHPRYIVLRKTSQDRAPLEPIRRQRFVRKSMLGKEGLDKAK